MKHALLALSLLFGTTSLAGPAKTKLPAKAALVSRIEKACRLALAHPDQDVPAEKEPGKICACVSAALGRKFGPD